MSKDIRSYFFKSSGKSTNKSECEAPQRKKRTHGVIESDDEAEEGHIAKKKPKELPQSSKTKSEKKKPEVILNVENFFGNKAVQQKKKTITPKKDDESKEKCHLKKHGKRIERKKDEGKALNDLSFENDDELEASILQTDDELLLPSEKKKSNDLQTNTSEAVHEKKKTPKKENDGRIKQNKTPKQDKEKTESGLLNSEQKRKHAEAYQKYLHRSGPKNPGSKRIPEGTPTCLQGLTFVITGVLDSLEREEVVELIQKCGGRVTGSISKKTHYVVVGEEPGVSKIQKADAFGTKKINEDELLNLIQGNSQDNDVEKNQDNFVEDTPDKFSNYKGNKKRAITMDVTENGPTKSKIFKNFNPKVDTKVLQDSKQKSEGASQKINQKMEKSTTEMLWVDKYKPKSTKHIIGQSGEKSNVQKLTKWLQNWYRNHSNKGGKKSARPAPWAQNDDGSYFKAALLSGPPGIGKTTTAHLVCQELGFDMIEFNASDTRSKKHLQQEISELLSTQSIRGYLQDSGENFRKHVLLMDEVDGMAGNEDRGGIQELIQLIKDTKVPIIGICNDRNHPKMRSVVNYCFDLRFRRPRVEQIKAAMKSVCFRENLEISDEGLEELIAASNHDLRQILHSLSMLASGQKSLTAEEVKAKGQEMKKPLNLGQWDVVRKVFTASEREQMSFAEKTELFMQDYSMGPLFVQDTYLRVKPYKAKNCEKKRLELIYKAAESISLGDVIEKTIRSQNAWSLLPVQAVFSSVLPGHHMSGHVQNQIQFPVWLGKNSRTRKLDRLLQDLHSSLRINITATKESTNLDYLNHFKDAILKPLVEQGSDGVQNSLEVMQSYHLTRDDLDSILELTAWPGTVDLYSQVDSKVKAALTRILNKEGLVTFGAKKSVKVKEETDSYLGDAEGDLQEEEEEEQSDNIDSDPLIKRGKPKIKKETENKGKTKDEKKKSAPKKETKKGKK